MKKKLIRIDNKIKVYKEPFNSILGKRITKYREEMGWTKYELATLSGLQPGLIITIESGDKKKVADASDIHRIAIVFKITMDKLIENIPVGTKMKGY